MKKNVKYEFGKGQKKALNLSKEFFEPVSAHSSEFWAKRAEENEKKAFALYNNFAKNASAEEVEKFWNSFKDQVEDMIEEAFKNEGLI